MPTLVKMDRRGRLVLPSELRRSVEGDTWEVQKRGGAIILIPVTNPLQKLRDRVSRAEPARGLDEVAEEEAGKSLTKG